MKNKIIYLVLLTITTFNSYSQIGKTAKAEKEYEKYAYIDAIKTYERIYEKGYKSDDMLLKLGNAYYFNAEFEKAAKYLTGKVKFAYIDIKNDRSLAKKLGVGGEI